MIATAIETISGHLNLYLKHEFDINEDVVILSNLLEQDGSVAPNLENKVVAFVVNCEKDSAPGQQGTYKSNYNDRINIGFVPVYINIYLMFACNFGGRNYSEALKFLSHIIGFFQRRPVWDHQNTPEMDEKTNKLCIDIVNLDIKDIANLWGVLSSKYLPSVIYKIRTFVFSSDGLQERAFSVRSTDRSVEKQ
jgi:hypothetical protein